MDVDIIVCRDRYIHTYIHKIIYRNLQPFGLQTVMPTKPNM